MMTYTARFGRLGVAVLAGTAWAIIVSEPALAEEPDPIAKALSLSVELSKLRGQEPEALPPIEPALMPPDPEEALSLRERATRMIHFIDTAAQGETWERNGACGQDTLHDRPGLCDLRWRKSDALSDFRARYQDATHGFKSQFVGDEMARRLELDLDTSPEIRFRWEFD